MGGPSRLYPQADNAGSALGELVIAHLQAGILQQLTDIPRTFVFPSGRIHGFDLDELASDFERGLCGYHTIAPLAERSADALQEVAKVSWICRKPRLSTESRWPGWKALEHGSSMMSGPDAAKIRRQQFALEGL
jgi:hypothetical protein